MYLPILTYLFIVTTFLTIYFFYKAANKSKTPLLVILLWMEFQAVLAYSGFYQKTNTIPPRFALMTMPAMVFILLLFITKKGDIFIDNLDTKTLTLLHVIRIPVEIVLWLLFIHETIPQLMTFEGRNYDILAGLTAPIMYYFGYIKKVFRKRALIVWNIISIGLLINIVAIAILSVPSNFQQLAFEQPNIAILYFPLVWLPSCVVPIVFLSHFATLRKLIQRD
jgi:hypothetical protein